LDDRLALLLHPVRIRLMHALRVGGRLTTSELCARLPDLSKASVYRQVERLVRGGVFEVESERRVRGVVERRYRLVPRAATVSADEATGMTLEDHRKVFTAAMAMLMADFGSYLDCANANPTADKVSYRQYVVWLSPEERAQLVDNMSRMLRSLMRKKSTGGRAPHILSTVFFPASHPQPPIVRPLKRSRVA